MKPGHQSSNYIADNNYREWNNRSKYDFDPIQMQKYVQNNTGINQNYNDPDIVRQRVSNSYEKTIGKKIEISTSNYGKTFPNSQQCTKSLPPYDKKVVIRGQTNTHDLSEQHKKILQNDPNAFHRNLGEFSYQASIRVQKN